MNVLVLGSINSQWTLQFVESFLLKNGYAVWIVKRSNSRKSRQWIAKYQRNGVHVIDCVDIVVKIKRCREVGDIFGIAQNHFRQIRRIAKAGSFNIVNLQFVRADDVIYAPILKYMKRAKLIFSYWGSDLLREDNKQLRLREKFVRRADFITFDNGDLAIEYKKRYKRALKVPSGTLLFGLPILDIIKNRCEERSPRDIRRELGIPEDKTIVAVGYSATAAHQHIKILKQIQKLDVATKEKIFLLLQMTYNGTASYINQVTNMAQETGCEYRVFRDFMSDSEVADIRIITDIYVNAQITDAFSGSVCENLFSGTVLINAKWLRYQEFKDYDFKFLEFENFEEINQLIKVAMERQIDVSSNKELVWQLRSWECCAPKWERMYQSLFQQGKRKRGLMRCKRQQLS